MCDITDKTEYGAITDLFAYFCDYYDANMLHELIKLGIMSINANNTNVSDEHDANDIPYDISDDMPDLVPYIDNTSEDMSDLAFYTDDTSEDMPELISPYMATMIDYIPKLVSPDIDDPSEDMSELVLILITNGKEYVISKLSDTLGLILHRLKIRSIDELAEYLETQYAAQSGLIHCMSYGLSLIRYPNFHDNRINTFYKNMKIIIMLYKKAYELQHYGIIADTVVFMICLTESLIIH